MKISRGTEEIIFANLALILIILSAMFPKETLAHQLLELCAFGSEAFLISDTMEDIKQN